MPDVLSRIAEAFGVEVYELFKTGPVLDDYTETVERLSEDLTKNVNQTITAVFEQYLGGKKD
jgi:hypothetical protein